MMYDQEEALQILREVKTVAEALRLSMPMVATLMDFAAELISSMIREVYKEAE